MRRVWHLLCCFDVVVLNRFFPIFYLKMSESMDVDPADPPNATTPAEKQNSSTATDIIVLDDDEVCDLTTTKIATKCINYACKSGADMMEPPSFCLSYYRVKTKVKRKQLVCTECYDEAVQHYDQLAHALVAGIPLVGVQVPFRNDVFEIDDSDSDSGSDNETIDAGTIRVLEEAFDETLGKMLETYHFDDQIDKCLQELNRGTTRIEGSFAEVRTTYRNIRSETDQMIFELSNLMRPEIHELPPWDLTNQTPAKKPPNRAGAISNGGGSSAPNNANSSANVQRSTAVAPQNILKSTLTRAPLKQIQATVPILPKSASPMATAALSSPGSSDTSNIAHITGEVIVIPADLPPVAEVIKAPLKLGEMYYANRSEMVGTWIKAKLTAFVAQAKYDPGPIKYEIMIESKQRTIKRVVTGKELAYSMPCNVQVKVGTRVIAVFRESTTMGELKKNKKDSFYPGIVAEPLQPANKYRYLIFFDDGYSQYVSHNHVHLIFESSKDVWEDINVNSRAFVKKYLENYENRAMVRFLKDQTVRTEHNGKWWLTTVINVDCSLVQVFFDDINRIEWIYRGSTRFAPMFEQEQAAANRQHKQRFSRKPNASGPYVEFTRMDGTITSTEGQQQQQRSVARKSTARPNSGAPQNPNSFLSVQDQEPPATKIVYYTPRRQKPKTNCYVAHNCCPDCRNYLFCPLGRMKGYSPLAKPLLCGFYRLMYKVKHKKFVMYRAPCGRTLRNMAEVHRYLQLIKSDLTVDLFDFNVYVRCLAEFMVESKSIIVKDLSQGKEDCPITVCNYVDSKQLDFCNYSTKRQPMEGVDLNLNPDFLVSCDCTDDCADKLNCSCWQLTLHCLKYMEKGTDPMTVGYQYRRLPEPLFTGIYECNQRCKCRHSCLNRVVQNPMQHKLQVFKTDSRGWGIRSLNDIPQGSFICIYAGSLLTEEMANLDGKSYGDEYLAELDFIETAERTKEDYEDDPYHDELVKEERHTDEPSGDEDALDDEEDFVAFRERRDDRDFVPTVFIPKGRGMTAVYQQQFDHETGIRSRLRKRNSDAKAQEKTEKKVDVTAVKQGECDDTVMISDDEDYPPREPSSFNPKGEVDDKDPRKYKSVREFFGSDEDVYIMDAKSTGNIGRFLNHSCSPNIFVQNVFVDTHDPRFPWVAFFTMCYVRAGTELTWNYNYDIGSVPGKVLYCYCGSSECKGRLL